MHSKLEKIAIGVTTGGIGLLCFPIVKSVYDHFSSENVNPTQQEIQDDIYKFAAGAAIIFVAQGYLGYRARVKSCYERGDEQIKGK